MKSALIGYGRWGQKLAPVIATRSELALVCSRSGVSSSGSGLPPGVIAQARHVNDVEVIFNDASIDAVFIATPMETHVALAKKALEQGKHVFVEKPLALDGADARSLVELAERRGRTLRVGHVLLHHAAFAAIRTVLATDPAVGATMTWTKLGTFDSDPWWNLGSHFASLALAIFGESPTSIRRHMEHCGLTERDVIAADLAFSAGRTCSMFIDRCAPRTARMVRVVTRSGRVLAWVDDELFELVEQRWRPVAIEPGSALDRQIADFFSAVSRTSSPSSPLADGRHGAATVELVARLLATGTS